MSVGCRPWKHRQVEPFSTMAVNFRRVRLERGFTIEELAERCQMSPVTVGRLEQPEPANSPVLKNVAFVAEELGIPLWALFLPGGADAVHILDTLSLLSPEDVGLVKEITSRFAAATEALEAAA